MLVEKSKEFMPAFYPYLDVNTPEVMENGWGVAKLKDNAPKWAKHEYSQWKTQRLGLTKY
ncbi:MAG: hypothetical protein E7572_07240 [Ruminococcaceae bacterium]|jgi:hypothetical protein|nr:hypothetical protein [Oscillospiraceae bacterium]